MLSLLKNWEESIAFLTVFNLLHAISEKKKLHDYIQISMQTSLYQQLYEPSQAGKNNQPFNCNMVSYFRFIVFVSYQMYYEYPPPTYLEYPILIAQDVILLLLILYYDGNLKQSVLYAALFLGGWHALTLRSWIIDLAMSLCTFISAASKLAQLQCLWESKDSGQVSALTWGLASFTGLARIYTTLMTTGDMQGERFNSTLCWPVCQYFMSVLIDLYCVMESQQRLKHCGWNGCPLIGPVHLN
ncbi:PQLC3 protein, partial [Amia calva]|nr:PQLC3 protein [Amia calva]